MRSVLKPFLVLAALCPMQIVATLGMAQNITIKIERGPDSGTDSPTKPPFSGQRPSADVAILLDTSNSMDGLINQARSQIWNIVQQFAKAKKAA